MTTDPIAAALPVCAGISYQLGVAGYFDASDYLRTDYMRGYVAATLADALEAERARAEKAETERDAAREAQIKMGAVFADTNPQARWVDDILNACTACGGSGHKEASHG